MRPARLLRHPEDILRQIFLGVFRVGVVILRQSGVMGFEGFGNIFQKDKPKDDMLIFRRLKIAAQTVSRFEQIGLKTEIGVARIAHAPAPAANRTLTARTPLKRS